MTISIIFAPETGGGQQALQPGTRPRVAASIVSTVRFADWDLTASNRSNTGVIFEDITDTITDDFATVQEVWLRGTTIATGKNSARVTIKVQDNTPTPALFAATDGPTDRLYGDNSETFTTGTSWVEQDFTSSPFWQSPSILSEINSWVTAVTPTTGDDLCIVIEGDTVANTWGETLGYNSGSMRIVIRWNSGVTSGSGAALIAGRAATTEPRKNIAGRSGGIVTGRAATSAIIPAVEAGTDPTTLTTALVARTLTDTADPTTLVHTAHPAGRTLDRTYTVATLDGTSTARTLDLS